MTALRHWVLLTGFCLLTSPAPGQDVEPRNEPAADEEEVHDELRALRLELLEAIEERDIERQVAYAHEDIVITWQNGEVVSGSEGLSEFLKQGENEVFQGYTQPPTPTDLSILHGGDTAISYGTSVAHYRIAGQEFDLTNHWSATLVNEGGEWKLANYHVSANVLDNPLLNAATGALYWVGSLALIVGLILGAIVMMVIGSLRKRSM